MSIRFRHEDPPWPKGIPADVSAKACELVERHYNDTFQSAALGPLLIPLFKVVPSHEDEIKLAACLAMVIAEGLEWTNYNILMRQCQGIFLQNVGLARAPECMDLIGPGMAPDLLLVHEQHPKVGAEMLMQMRDLHESVRQIVHQHHEYFDGSGMPNRLMNNRIYGPARLACFVSELSEIMVRQEMTALEGIRTLMITQGRITHYDPQYVRTLLQILAHR